MNDLFSINPPIYNNYVTLPYGQLTWEMFENLCMRLLYAKYGAENVSKYGTRGQNQFGFDVLVRDPDTGRYRLYQCKKVQKFDGADLRNAIEKWEKDKWYSVTDRFVVFSSDELISTSFVDEFELQKKRLAGQNIELSKLGSHELDMILKSSPDIVEEFFGLPWREKFSLSQPAWEAGLYTGLTIPKKAYPQVPHYIERLLVDHDKKVNLHTGHFTEVLTSLFSCIERALLYSKPARLILKAEAACGKSKELENLAYRYTRDEKCVYPVLVRLVNFRSDLSSYVSSFFKDWDKLPPQNVLILFDGLDEIPSAYFDDFTKEFNLFLQTNNALNIVASIRTNVFTSDIGNGIDEENKLVPIYLTDLTSWDIANYLNERLDTAQLRRFDFFCQRNWVQELIYNPFYLCSLVDLFLVDEKALPKNRTEVVDKIIQHKISKDKNKYGAQLPVDALIKFSGKLALYLTLTGNNAIPENRISEFTRLSAGEVFRCGLFKKEDMGSGNILQFEHNNFQEYLAAKKLSDLTWVMLDDILFHNVGASMLKPKMFNMANFLFTILPADSESFHSLFKKIRETKPSILLQFERDKVSADLRLQIFKGIILDGKAEGIYYLSGDFRGPELMDFVNYSSDGFNFLLEELDNADQLNHLYCLLDMIYYYQQIKVTSAAKVRLLHIIQRIILTAGFDHAIYDRAIDILTNYRFFEHDLLENTIKQCSLIDHYMVRGAAIKYIDAGNFPDEYEYVLSSVVALTKDKDRRFAGLDKILLDYVLKRLDERNAVVLITYLGETKNRQKQYNYSHLSNGEAFLDRIYLRLGQIFTATRDEAILKAYFAFLAILRFQPHKIKAWGKPMVFFDALPDREDYFMPLFLRANEEGMEYILGYLFTENLAERLLTKFVDQEISEEKVNSFRWSLQSTNRPLHDYLQARLLKIYGQRFAYRPYPNWDLINAEREARDLVLIGDRLEFLKEAKTIYRLINAVKKKHDDDEGENLFTLEYNEKKEVREKIKSSIVFSVIHAYEIRGGYKEFEKIFDEKGWEWFVFQQIEQYLTNKTRELIAPELLAYYNNYLIDRIVPQIDFDRAIIDGLNGEYTINNSSQHLVNYYRYNAVKLNTKLTLELLKLDYQGHCLNHSNDDEKERPLFEVIYGASLAEDYKEAVLKNLGSTTLSRQVRATHAVICATYGYQESAPLLLDILREDDFDGYLKKDVVDALMNLTGDAFAFEALLTEWTSITFEWQLKVLDLVIPYPEFKERLILLLENSVHDPFYENVEVFWRHSLLRSGIVLGSQKIASKQFEVWSERLYLSDYLSYNSNDFDVLIATKPKWLLTWSLELISKLAPLIKDRRNELAELLEEIIRKCAVINRRIFEHAIGEYEKIIEGNLGKNPDVIYLKWYERRLIKSYYNHVSKYETDEAAWEIITKVGN